MTALRTVLPWLLAALLVAGVASTFAPWFRSGDSRRTSYETVTSATRLDLVEGPAADVTRATWPFVPFVASLAVLALLLEKPRVAAVLSSAVGIALFALALVVHRARDHAAWGATAAFVLGPALVAVSTLLLTTVTASPGGERART